MKRAPMRAVVTASLVLSLTVGGCTTTVEKVSESVVIQVGLLTTVKGNSFDVLRIIIDNKDSPLPFTASSRAKAYTTGDGFDIYTEARTNIDGDSEIEMIMETGTNPLANRLVWSLRLFGSSEVPAFCVWAEGVMSGGTVVARSTRICKDVDEQSIRFSGSERTARVDLDCLTVDGCGVTTEADAGDAGPVDAGDAGPVDAGDAGPVDAGDAGTPDGGDVTAPDAPVLSTTIPASPSSQHTITVIGSAESGSTVRVYGTSNCAGTLLGSATASGGVFSVPVDVTSTQSQALTFYANATDSASNTSTCSSTGLPFIHLGSIPLAPSVWATTPASPADAGSILVRGNPEMYTTVSIYASATCANPSLATGDWSQFGDAGILVTTNRNQTTTYYASAARDAGVSECSDGGVTFVEDSLAPAAPSALATTPATTGNTQNILVRGTAAEATGMVVLYTTVDCTGLSVGTGTTSVFSDAGIAVSTAGTPGTYTYYATHADVAGNVSECSDGGVAYVFDNVAPSAPEIASTNPPATSKDASVGVIGTAETGTTIRVFFDAGCPGSPVATGSAEDFGDAGVTAGVPYNTTVRFFATAVDLAGNTSACSDAGPEYLADNISPTITGLTTSPTSPSNSLTPKIRGTTESVATVQAHTADTCASPAGSAIIGSVFSDSSTDGGLDVSILPNTANSFWVLATDPAGNTSLCYPVSYVHDSEPPTAPSGLSTTPATTGNASTVVVRGTVSAGAYVRLFTDSACDGGALADGGADAFDAGFSVAVSLNATTSFYAAAYDSIGNGSACTGPVDYTHDNVPPAAPADSSTSPASGANDNFPFVRGTAETDSNIFVTVGSCFDAGGVVMVTGTAEALGTTGLQVADGGVRGDFTTTFYLAAVDPAGNRSACSTLSYVENSAVPAVPSITGTSPVSPASSSSPKIHGTSTAPWVLVYANDSTCDGGTVADGGVDAFDAGLTVVLSGLNATTTFYAKGMSGTNVSSCSNGVAYAHDSIAPDAAVVLSVSPGPNATTPTPKIIGKADPSTYVFIFRATGCTGSAVADGGVGAFADGGLQVATVVDAGTYTFWALVRDYAGNTSACSTTSVSYTYDNVPPSPPVAFATTPTSPANMNDAGIRGTAEATGWVRLFTNNTCSGGDVGKGTGAQFSSAGGIGVQVLDNTTTTYWATQQDDAGNVSVCSATVDASVTYREDSLAPPTPSGLTLSIATPNNNNSPKVYGTLSGISPYDIDASIVRVFSNSTCTTAIAQGTDYEFRVGGGIAVAVSDNTTTDMYLQVVDPAGNDGGCSARTTYVEDSVAPFRASSVTVLPSPRANNNTPKVKGAMQLDAGDKGTTTIRVFSNSTCTAFLAQGTDDQFLDGGVSISVSDNTTTTFYVQGIDRAGNDGGCSIVDAGYTEDSVAPFKPTGLTTDIASPSQDASVRIKGSVQLDAGDQGSTTIRIYSNSTCTTLVAQGNDWEFTDGGILLTDISPNSSNTYYVAGVDSVGNDGGCSAAYATYIRDNTAPTFGGGTAAAGNSVSQITVFWDAGRDTYTPDASIVYDICRTTSQGGCLDGGAAFVATYTTTGGKTWFDAGALDENTRYYFVVRARDEAANRDSNSVEVSGKTHTTGSVLQVAAGTYHTCALLADGTISCWGYGYSGQLGNGTTFTSTAPQKVTGISNAIAIAAGSGHTCAVLADGTVQCWGNNDVGQIGNGELDAGLKVLLPEAVYETPTSTLDWVTSISAGNNSTCARRASGYLRCWGGNSYGQLGFQFDGGLIDSPWAKSPGLTTAESVATGGIHACAIVGGGSVQCWGSNSQYQLGHKDAGNETDQTVQNLADTTALSLGYYHSCAQHADGTVSCWGDNINGQVGNGGNTATNYDVPQAVTNLSYVMSLATSSGNAYHTCAVRSSGFTRCWGDNDNGQLGNDAGPTDSTTVVTPIGVNLGVSISVGGNHTCVCRADGKLECWGDDGSYQLGDDTSPADKTYPVPVDMTNLTSISGATQIVTGSYHTCSLLSTGEVKCWGRNAYGQLGNDGGTGNYLRPVDVASNNRLFRSLGAGLNHTCGISVFDGGYTGGEVFCWGQNNYGQLGDGTSGTDRFAPVMVGGLADQAAVEVVGGAYHTCARTVDGNVYCWGYNANGQLGNGSGSAGPFLTPQYVDAGGRARAIATGDNHSCALLADGTTKCWGRNYESQIGNDAGASTYTSPQLVVGTSGGIALSAGKYHTCVLEADGETRCWGDNSYQQIANNATTEFDTATSVSGTTDYVRSLGVGYNHNCAVWEDGTVRCWGYNGAGSLGNGGTDAGLGIVTVTGLSNVRAISVGKGLHSCAILVNGTAACWGYNYYGQVGDETSVTPRTAYRDVVSFP